MSQSNTAEEFQIRRQTRSHRNRRRDLKSPDQVCKLIDLDRRFVQTYSRMCRNELNSGSADAGANNETRKRFLETEIKRVKFVRTVLNKAFLCATAMKDIVVVFVTRRLHKYKQLRQKQMHMANQLADLYAIEYDAFQTAISSLIDSCDDWNRFKGRIGPAYNNLVTFGNANSMTLQEFESSGRRVLGSSYKFLLSSPCRYVYNHLNGAVYGHNQQCRHTAEKYGADAVAKWFNTIVAETYDRVKRVNQWTNKQVIVAGSGLMSLCIAREIYSERK